MRIGSLDFDKIQGPHIMGILNTTPDSFSDGGRFLLPEAALERGLAIAREGGHLIDIGGESTRPGASYVDAEEEMRRILPAIRSLKAAGSLPISVDTYKASVAAAALEAGADMINDVTGLWGDPDMARVVGESGVPVCIMMNRRLMEPTGDIFKDLDGFFRKSLDLAEKAGIREDSIILDPGIGFGLEARESFQILHHLERLREYGMPILLGASRKRIIWQTLGVRPEEALAGTLATTALGVFKGADIIRVHDVAENVKCALVANEIRKNQ